MPVFIVLSFYLCADQLNIANIRKRIWRIGFPYFFWIGFSFILYNIIGIILDNSQLKFTLIDLILNLLTGIGINSVMWFQLILFVLTILLSILNQYGKLNNALLTGFIFLCTILQYTGINYMLFKNSSIRIVNSYARMVEVVPFAAMGILLKRSEKQANCKIEQMMLGLLILELGSNFWGTKPPGFSFQGLNMLILATILVIFFKELTVFDKHYKLSLLINKISSYTMGIYFIHCMIRDLGQPIFLAMGTNGLLNSFIIYLTSLLLSIIVSKIPAFHLKELVR